MSTETKPIEVERITLEGRVTRIEPLSNEWHQKHVGPREVGLDVKRIEQGLPNGKYVKTTLQFENPLNPSKPVIEETWPVREDKVDIRANIKLLAYIYNNALYIEKLKSLDPKIGGDYSLQAVHEGTQPREIAHFTIRGESK